MKKLTAILLLAALLMPVVADAAETYGGRVLDRGGLAYKPHSNVPLTAKVERYHENGQLKRLYTLIDGKEQGLNQWWWGNGQLMAEETYVDGKAEGLFQVWHDNGQLDVEYCYRAGEETDMAYCKKEKQ